MCLAIKDPIDQRLARRCRISVSLCLVLYLGSSQLASRSAGTRSLIFAGLAGAFFFAELVSVGLLILRLRDEFHRILLARSFLWGTVITMGVATVWGFVELHSKGTALRMPVLFVPAFLICATTVAKLLIFRSNRPVSD